MNYLANKSKTLPVNYPQLSYALYFVYILGIIVHLLFLFAFRKLGVKEMMWINYLSPFIYLTAIILNKKGRMVLAASIAVSEAVLHGVISLVYVGWESNFHLYVILVYMLIFFLYKLHIIIRISLALAITLAYTGCYFFSVLQEPVYQLPEKFTAFAGIFNIVANAVVLSVFALIYSHFIRKNVDILQSAEEQQRKLNAQKNRFFSIFSHDLKNPVTSLRGFVDLMLRRYDGMNDDKRKVYMVQVQHAVNDLHVLVMDLLEWSKSQLDNIKIYPEELNVFQKINDVKNLLKHHAVSKEIELKLNIETGLNVYADQHMFKSIMRNLISNAIKFTPHKGKVIIAAQRNEGETYISVKDTGIGISEENRESLFRMDKKNISRGTDNEIGTGLGLVVVKEFVEKNHGRVMYTSEVNKGTTFTVILPATNE